VSTISPLEALIPRPRRTILSLLFASSARWWTLAELSGRTGLQPSTISRHLNLMCRGGVVAKRTDGGRAAYRPDADCIVFADLHAITQKAALMRGETILLVDDQEATAHITRILLESWGYRVLESHDGIEAIDLFERENGEVHLLIADVLMPHMAGPQLARELTRRNPNLNVLFLSGHLKPDLEGVRAGFLAKPFNPASLARMVRKELDRTLAAR
jgi:CheY-like chemotaxis protein